MPQAEQVAVRELRGIVSNIQFNRDGTVRFVRFSHAQVKNEHVQRVRAFTRLDYLAVVTPTVNDEGLDGIGELAQLDTLFLSDSGITDTTLTAVPSLPRLERLYLDRTGVTDAGLARLSVTETLKIVSLNDTQVTDAGLQYLAGLTGLEALFLNRCAISDAGLQHLAGLENLTSLSLAGCRISDAGLASLTGLKKLADLDLSETAVSAEGLRTLKPLGALSQVLLRGTTITGADLVTVQADLPKTSLHVDPAEEARLSAWQRFRAGQPLRGPAPIAASAENVAPVEIAGPAQVRFLENAETPDFQRHVIPLLGKLGCNGRNCHGSFQGRGGFRLSMFGYDFKADHAALSERLDLESPEDSLMLLKPTMQADHKGGLRFPVDGWEHALLLRWIRNQARGTDPPHLLTGFEVTPAEMTFAKPGETVQLRAVAVWSDGFREDVTCLTRFQSNDDAVAEVSPEGLVTSRGAGDTYVVSFYDKAVASSQVLLPISDLTGDRFPPVPAPTEVDKLVVSKLSRLGIVPSDLCTDDEFLRRVTLDLAGTLPTPAEIQSFQQDTAPDKRVRKIDALLESPAYVEWWTVKFSDLTGSNSQHLGTTDMNSPAAEQWNAWIRKRIAENVGWDELAAGIILAESRRPGETYDQYAAEQSRMLSNRHPEKFEDPENPMHYYWFRGNLLQPEERALSFGYVFLGVRLQCAQCHKHPFDQWSQQDFQQFTQFFTRIKAGVAPDARDAQTQLKTKLGVPVKLDTAALRRQDYLRVSAEGLPIPWNEIWIDKPPAQPQIARLLGEAEFNLNDYADPREPLMAWLLHKDNRYFAPAFVNRIWEHYFGVGIVNPPDDFNLANPPGNKPLLEWLSREFVAHKYDIKWLHRTIASSRTYQLSWKPNDTNRRDERNFSHALIRRLPAEVTMDAILQATANEAKNNAWLNTTTGRRIAQHPRSIASTGIDFSLLVFGKPLRNTNCDCERQMQPTLLQSLYVRNDEETIGWLERPDGWLMETARQLGDPLVSEVDPDKTLAPSAPEKSAAVEAAALTGLVTNLYLRTVSRPPSAAEVELAIQHLGTAENRTEGFRDLLWTLINTQEFLTNH